MVVLAEPDPNDMVMAITKAIDLLPQIDPEEMHHRVSVFSDHIQKNLILTIKDKISLQ